MDNATITEHGGGRSVNRFTFVVAALLLPLVAFFGYGTQAAQASTGCPDTQTVCPNALDFGTVVVDDTSVKKLVTIDNVDATVPLVIDDVSVLGDGADFDVSLADGSPITGPITVAPGETTVLAVRFNPKVVGPSDATLNLLPRNPLIDLPSIDLSGDCVANSKPAITKVKPKGEIKDRTPAIKATVRDAQTDLLKRNVKLFVDGKRITKFSYDRATDRLAFTPKRKMSIGKHTLKIVARDAHGAKAVKKWDCRLIRTR